MASKHLIKLPNDLVKRSWDQGRRIVAAYQRGENAASLAVSSHGAEDDAELQAKARMAECAYCVWAKLDPSTALQWGDRCDPGWDVKHLGLRVDVKRTHGNGRYLLWPVNKRQIFESKPFHL